MGGGCVDKLVSTYVYRAGGKEGGSAVERAINAGSLQMENYCNFQYNARMEAGKHGFSFMQVLGSRHDDRSFQEAHIHGRRQVQNYNLPLSWQEDPHRPCSQP